MRYTQSFGIQNPNGAIPDLLYKDVRGTDAWSASTSQELSPCVYAKVTFPNSNYTLLAVEWGGVTDAHSQVLVCVDPLGIVTNTLLAEYSWGFIMPRQFRIFEDGRIVVSTLVPLTDQSLPFGTFTQFLGEIKDETYRIDANGQFVKEEGKNVRDRRVYTRQELDSKTFNLF
ncbi:MAG: hypothetical protein ACI36X_05585 [Bacteroidaceae bacterium]